MANNYSTGKKEKEITGGGALPVQAYKAPSVSAAAQNLAQLRAGYKPEQDSAVTAAKSKLDALQKPSQSAQLMAVRDKVLSRSPFSYDMNADTLYQQYKDSYTRQGKLAMQDTVGQAAALTGGYGNSYAQTAGQQVYNGYMQQLNDVVPQLYQLALDKYNQETSDLYNKYGLYKSDYDTKYGKHRDDVADYNAQLDYLTGRYDTERQFDYSQYTDAYNRAYTDHTNAIANAQWQQEFDEARRQYNADLALRQRQHNDDMALRQRQYNDEMALAAAKAESGDEEPFKPYTFSHVDEDGLYHFYRDGKDYKFEKGKNPYPGAQSNSDIQYGAFSNGYQPDNVGGEKLHPTGLTTDENNGVNQNIWMATDKWGLPVSYFVWDGTKGKYEEVDDPTGRSKYANYGFPGGR